MERPETTVSEKLDKLLTSFEEIQEKKKFKLPFGAKPGVAKRKKNYAIVQILKTNGAVDFKMFPIEDNTIKVGDIYYETTTKHVFRYKKYPLVIILEWNITPVSKPEEHVFNPEENLSYFPPKQRAKL